jgi:hypothetical protein
MTKDDDQRFFFDFNDNSMMVIRSFISNNRSQQVSIPNSKSTRDTNPRTIKRFDSNQDHSSRSSQEQQDNRARGEMTETESTEDCSSVCSDDTFARNTRQDGTEQRHFLGTFEEDEDDDEDVYDEDGFGIVDSDEDDDYCNVDGSKQRNMKQKQVSNTSDIFSSVDCDCSSVDVSSICSSDSFQISPTRETCINESTCMHCKINTIQEVHYPGPKRSNENIPSKLFIPLSREPSVDSLDEDDSICSEIEDQEKDNGDAVLFAKKRQSSFLRMRNMLSSPRPSNHRKIANPKPGTILSSTLQSPIRNRKGITGSPIKQENTRGEANRCFIFDGALATPVKAPQRQASWAHSSQKLASVETPQTPASAVSPLTKVRFFDQVKVREFISDVQSQSKDSNEQQEQIEVSMSLWDSLRPDKFVPLREFIYVEGSVPYCLTPRSMKKKQLKRNTKKNKKMQPRNKTGALTQAISPQMKKKKTLNTLLKLPFSPAPNDKQRCTMISGIDKCYDDDDVSNDEDFSTEFRNVLHMIESAKDNIDQALLACEEKNYLVDS